jgi:hypothetical protein
MEFFFYKVNNTRIRTPTPPIRLHRVMLNYLSTCTALPYSVKRRFSEQPWGLSYGLEMSCPCDEVKRKLMCSTMKKEAKFLLT